jgi:hypothetical protein
MVVSMVSMVSMVKIYFLFGGFMNNEVFKAKIYEPYLKAWKILKLIQHADQSSDSDEVWQLFIKEIDRLNHTYPDNAFAQDLIRLLIDAGDHIARMNKEGA